LPTEEEWIEIQKVLSCAIRLQGRFGKARMAQVLTGSQDKAIVNTRLQSLSTYGIMAECSQAYVRNLIDTLIDEGCLDVVGDEYPTIKATGKGRQVVHRKQPVFLRPRKLPDKKLPLRSRPNPSPSLQAVPPDDRLVKTLKLLRTKLARERGVPPYVILHNQTIMEIAKLAPTSEQALLAVKGVGPAKLQSIGKQVLDAVRLLSSC
jgi:ATP-dependent DNA helicase RecQ